MRDDVVALYVDPRGPYPGLVAEWYDEARDARTYAGPWPVVAHPPCQRWGRYWYGGPSARERKTKGADGGCFAHALEAVRKWGGVIEHPEASHAWRAHGLIAPPREGGWVTAGDFRGWTCCVEQGHYGHRARKATWLYACGVTALPSLRWGPSARAARLDQGFYSAEERAGAKAAGWRESSVERLSVLQRLATPLPFAELLLSLAAQSRRTVAA